MNTKLFSLALLQLGLSLVFAVLAMFFTFRLFRFFLVKKYKIQLDNISFALLMASILFSVGHIISGVIRPMLNAIRTLSEYSKSPNEILIKSIQYSLLFVGLGLFISLIVIVIGLYLFTLLTRNINEFEEIGKDNKAVGILTGVIIVVISLFVQDSVVLLLESLIPYPDFPVRT